MYLYDRIRWNVIRIMDVSFRFMLKVVGSFVIIMIFMMLMNESRLLRLRLLLIGY